MQQKVVMRLMTCSCIRGASTQIAWEATLLGSRVPVLEGDTTLQKRQNA